MVLHIVGQQSREHLLQRLSVVTVMKISCNTVSCNFLSSSRKLAETRIVQVWERADRVYCIGRPNMQKDRNLI